jgi:hypothetical protein
MKKKMIFAIALLVLLASTAIAFAQTTATTAISIQAGSSSGGAAVIKTLNQLDDETGLKYSTGSHGNFTSIAPSWDPVVEHAGAVTPGDLYYIDCGDYQGDVLVTLHLTNASELSVDYSYLDVRVGVYEGDGDTGNWDAATEADNSTIGTVYLTFINGQTTFILHGNTQYCISIDGGDYYCIDTDADGGSLDPKFYLDVSPI